METAVLVGTAEYALKTLAGMLLQEIMNAKDKVKQYKVLLERLEETVTSLPPKFEEIEEYDRILGHPDEQDNERLRKILEDGIGLVSECGEKVRWWNCCCKKAKYADKLKVLQENLLNFTQTTMVVQQRRDILQLTVKFDSFTRTISADKENGKIIGSCAVPQAPKLVVGLEGHLIELKMRLRNDQTSICILSAPGGCGKTTLATKLCHDEEIDTRFKDNIFFIYVSRRPNLKAMVQKIFEHKNVRFPEPQTDEDAINHLERLLRSIQRPILLVLDDVWSGSEGLIEQFQTQIKDYKILVTSRSVLPRFDSTYSLSSLNNKDAKTLFLHAASSQVENFDIPDDLVDKVIEVCKCLPLALKVLGRSLCRQPEAVWRNKLLEGSNGFFKFDSDGGILECLKTSLDVLDTQMKDCFMDLGSFPEDQKISAQALIDMWAELYEMDEDGVKAMAKVYDLCDRNLASLTITREKKAEFDNCYYGHFVMQHDLLRELAIYQSGLDQVENRQRLLISVTGNNFPNWWKEQSHKLITACLLSISTDEDFSSKWLSMKAPNVKVIVLNFQSKSYIFPHFLKEMEKAEALIATNCGYYPTELSNFLVFASLPSLKRIRLENVFLPFPRKSSARYKTLQKITLVLCRFDKEFKNFDIADAFPNLAEFNIDYSSDLMDVPPSLCNILTLRKLRFTNCPSLKELPEEIGRLTNLEELRLGSCTNLEMLPASIGNLRNLRFLDISDCLNIWDMQNAFGDLHNLRILHMKKCLSLRELPPSTKNLKNLKVICDEEGATLWRPFQRNIVNLNIVIRAEEINLRWL